jgi:hypothetical protein
MRDLYEHLRAYGLVKRDDVTRRLDGFTESELSGLLESYLEAVSKRPLVFRSPLGVTDIYPDSRAMPLPLDIIRQLAIYAGRIYVHDPLLDMVYKWKNLDFDVALVAQYPTREQRAAHFRDKLGSVVEKLLLLQPLVEPDIIHLAPTQLVQPRREPGALYKEDFYGPAEDFMDKESRRTLQDLPPQLREYCERSLSVLPAELVDGGVVVLSEGLVPRNMYN